ncbi:MAG: CYTH domain-containing protein [Candidatus Paceibacterota bacterium]|jgi:adenylate cyclase class 2
MKTEVEATFIPADHIALRKKLGDIGAKLIRPERLIRRTIFDYEDLRLDAKAAWVRLRDEGDSITLTFKQRTNETINGMKEIEIVVDDYIRTKELLLAIGLIVKAEQETKRELWEIDGTQVMLDTWPWLEPIAEIEGESEETVKELSQRLGFDWTKAIFDSADELYRLVFDVTRTEISTCPLTFGPVPAWLEKRRRAH